MARTPRARFVPLTALLRRRFPTLPDPQGAILEGQVLVDGRVIANQRALVRGDASVRVLGPRVLRGEQKLARALDAFALDVSGMTAVDIGAAAGGFTAALLARGARCVYAVDVGHGQLRGRLRIDPRVVNLERTNVADLDEARIPEAVDLVTLDLSYLPVARAVGQLSRLRYTPAAVLVAVVKPVFELRTGSPVTESALVHTAVRIALEAVDESGWRPDACTLPAVTGAGGAVEAFVLARRQA